MPRMEKFSDLLASARRERGMQSSDLARLIGVEPSTITRYENGERRPRMEHVVKMANVLGADGNRWLLAAGYPQVLPARRPRKSAAGEMTQTAALSATM